MIRGAANSFILALLLSHAYSFSVPSHQRTTTTTTTTMMMMNSSSNSDSSPSVSRRDAFLTVGAGVIGATSAFVASTPAIAAAPKIYTLESGIKYAITKEATTNTSPYTGDIVAIEYTGYLTSGQIFDATHSEGKSNALLFKLGTGSVIPGLDIMVANMKVGQKVQAIIPPNLAYADKGVCLDDGECLIKPGSTLVYDIILKKSSVPPP